MTARMAQPVSAHTTWGWVLYDWANSAFATTVMAGFFPVFFKQYWAADLAVTESTRWLGYTTGAASLLVVLLAPMLGALADQGGLKKRLLLAFAGLGVGGSAALYLVGQGAWELALLVYLLGILGFSGSNIFYDALLVDVAARDRLERVSAQGFAFGYLGGGLLFAFNVWLVSEPTRFGLADAAQAVRLSFLSVAVWWGLFTIPLLLFVQEHRTATRRPWHRLILDSGRQLAGTVRHLRTCRSAFIFLLAYWLYIDGVDTIVRMAVDYGLNIGLEATDLLSALLLTQFVGFPAALVFGHIGGRYGPRAGIQIAILVYVLVVFWAWQMQSSAEFYALAVVIGLVQGGIQALSRAYFARLIPAERAGEFFGLYNMMGKSAAIIGPVMVGWLSAESGNPRLGILSVLLLFISGAYLLHRVRPAQDTLE